MCGGRSASWVDEHVDTECVPMNLEEVEVGAGLGLLRNLEELELELGVCEETERSRERR